MIKERFELAASSLSSYFGVGFNTPEEQIQYDLGNQENTFDDAAKDRMMLGTLLEDAALNYAEYKLEIAITNRNIDVVTAFDGMLRCKLDGETILNGEQTVVENKVSNALTKKFTEDLGYYLQCQAYMEHTGYKQALLCGLYHGKFIWKIIPRDDATIEIMREVIQFVWEVLNGIADMADFPYALTDEWAKRVPIEEVKEGELTETDTAYMDELFDLSTNPEYKRIDKRMTEIKDYLKMRFRNQKVVNEDYTCSISLRTNKGTYDMDELKNTYPTIDLEDFRKPESTFTVVTITPKKKAK